MVCAKSLISPVGRNQRKQNDFSIQLNLQATSWVKSTPAFMVIEGSVAELGFTYSVGTYSVSIQCKYFFLFFVKINQHISISNFPNFHCIECYNIGSTLVYRRRMAVLSIYLISP